MLLKAFLVKLKIAQVEVGFTFVPTFEITQF